MNGQEAKYYIKTKLGVSEDYVMHSVLNPWYGTGQGATDSPVIWIVICSSLFDAYEEQAHGAVFESPDGSVSIKIFMVGFVDDNANSVNDFLAKTIPSPEVLVAMAQQDRQLWHDLLWRSGQALELKKCLFYHYRFDYKPDGT